MAWHYALLNQTTLPKFDWRLDRDGSISVSSETKPAVVRLWYASNSQAMDFRLETIGPAWRSISIDPIPGRPSGLLSYRGNVDSPTKGWTAYFVELTFEIGAPRPLKLTTQVYVTPDRLPFPPPKPLRSFSSRLLARSSLRALRSSLASPCPLARICLSKPVLLPPTPFPCCSPCWWW